MSVSKEMITKFERLTSTPLGQRLMRESEQSAEADVKRKKDIERLNELKRQRLDRRGAKDVDAKEKETRLEFETLRRKMNAARREHVIAIGAVMEWQTAIDKEIAQLTMTLKASAPAAIRKELDALPTDIEVVRDPAHLNKAERVAALEEVKRRRAELTEQLFTEIDETGFIIAS